MKKALILTCLLGLAVGAVLAADQLTKADYLAGSPRPLNTAPKAGSDDCTSPTPVGDPLPYNDTGDTTGASDSISEATACPGLVNIDNNVFGPDHVYLLTVGPGNDLTVTLTTSDDNFDPAIYVLSVCGDGAECEQGADQCAARSDGAADNPCDPESTESFGLSGLAPGLYYLYVDSFWFVGEFPGHESGPYTLDVTGTLPVQLMDFAIE